MTRLFIGVWAIVFGLGIPAFRPLNAAAKPPAPDIRQITILATNDIHGGVEPSPDEAGRPYGGFALWGGIVDAIRTGIRGRLRSKGDVILLDAGDQFQGTLISNYNEGQLVISSMAKIGYDAIVPGNHDYDFGPLGWLTDQSNDASKRRETLLNLQGSVSFPFLSANTYYRNSIQDAEGKTVEVDSNYCQPADGRLIDWTRAKRPEFLTPYLKITRAGVRIAVIAIDHPLTSQSTTAANVEDLCFDDEFNAYERVRRELEGQADVFVLLMHNGDKDGKGKIAALVRRLAPERGPRLVDAVISGHTHSAYNEMINGVPYIQSGSGGKKFGRVDLFWDVAAQKLALDRTKSVAGVRFMTDSCDELAKAFCVPLKDGVSYEGKTVVPNAAIAAAIKKAREAVAPIASRKLGNDLKEVAPNRVDESALGDAFSDALRAIAKADLGMINTGGMRAPLPKGEFTYEDLFRVLPFNNHGVVVAPFTAAQLVSVLEKSVKTCGALDALIISGIKVTFQRNCSTEAAMRDGVDADAKLIHVETLKGEVIYDATAKPQPIKSTATFQVATLDFVASGGGGFTEFKGISRIADMGIFREKLTDVFLKSPATFKGETDGRWRNLSVGP
jgi:2',3'-cyclic-nucleotide 2'-phosphodiesterase (5'-nucleotidase family)